GGGDHSEPLLDLDSGYDRHGGHGYKVQGNNSHEQCDSGGPGEYLVFPAYQQMSCNSSNPDPARHCEGACRMIVNDAARKSQGLHVGKMGDGDADSQDCTGNRPALPPKKPECSSHEDDNDRQEKRNGGID